MQSNESTTREFVEDIKQKRIEEFVKKYVLPLIGYTVDQSKLAKVQAWYNKAYKYIPQNNEYYYVSDKICVVCKVQDTEEFTRGNNKLFECAMADYINFESTASKFFPESESVDTALHKLVYESSIERGMCRWMSDDVSYQTIEELLRIIKKWAIKTYEGHHVCFGFVVDLNDNTPPKEEDYYSNFMQFLDDEYSAMLSDGFTSLIKVNRACQFVEYLSLTKGGSISSCELDQLLLPYRFAQLIDKFVSNGTKDENYIGILLLQNGDIIISKDKEIRFIKRNNKWLNFSPTSFKKSINSNLPYFGKNKEIQLEKIYVTALDVSLSHSGGIIAVVDEEELKKDKSLNRIDDIFSSATFKDLYFDEFKEKYKVYITGLSDYYKKLIRVALNNKDREALKNAIQDSGYAQLEVLHHDILKRLTKRKVIKDLLKEERNFSNIDRKLRAELIGMDGACIVNKDFNIVSFGAIIKADAGSSGGGRGAAAKKLSTYGGFSIKISTDGYIEVYHSGKRIYSIK